MVTYLVTSVTLKAVRKARELFHRTVKRFHLAYNQIKYYCNLAS